MYTYNSHRKSQNRAFDHLYDPNFASNEKIMHKLNSQAICKTAPLHIIPCFYSMFSENRRSKFYFPQRNGLPYDSSDCTTKTIDKRPVNLNLFSSQSWHSNEIFRLAPKNTKIIKSFKKNRICQTVYREVEIQTDSYLPQPSLRLHEKCAPEILYVECDDEPDIEHVKKIERVRLRREWENHLRDMDLSLEEKVNQMEIFEFESILAREKELNELQHQRMEYVIDFLEQSEEKRKQCCKEKILKIYKAASVEKILAREKIENKAQRKLRKLSNFSASKGASLRANILPRTKSLNFELLDEFNAIEFDKNIKFDKYERKALWLPKQKPKVFDPVMKNENKLNDIYESIKNSNSIKKSLKPRCRKANIVEEYSTFECAEDQTLTDTRDKIVLIQKIMKGKFIQNSLLAGMKEHVKEIRALRRQFPLGCVVEVLGEEYWMPKIEEDTISTENKVEEINDISTSESSIDVTSESSNTLDIPEIQKEITNVLQYAALIAQDIINRKILKEANDERIMREEAAKIEALNIKIASMKRELIERKSETFFANTVTEVIQLIVPLVIEEISEKDALEFVMKKAAEISADACNKNINNAAKVEKFLNEILIPHIESKSHESDEHLIALYGSVNAFNDFIEKYFSIEQ